MNNIKSAVISNSTYIRNIGNSEDEFYNTNYIIGTQPVLNMPFIEIVDEKEFVNLEYQYEEQYNQLILNLETKLVNLLKNFVIENDVMSEAEKEIANIARKYSFDLLGDIITNIYTKYYSNTNVIVGICVSLERFDSDEVNPWGQSIVYGLMKHPDDIVKEHVISLIDNWEDTSLLPVLKNMNITCKWMTDYVNDVIKHLEDK